MSSKCLSKSNSKNVNFKSSYSCVTCKKSFKEFIIFEGHFAFNATCRAKNGWFIKCYVCGHKFRYLAELKYHIRRHTVNCRTNSRAINNENGHSPTDGFQCNICQKNFRTKFYLKLHRETHWKETSTKKSPISENTSVEILGQLPPSLECQISTIDCSDTTKRGEHNIDDIREGPKCEICNLQFTTEVSLRFHRKRLHGSDAANRPKQNNLSQFQCEICKAKFTFKVNLTKHRLDHTIGEDECEICHIKFTKKGLEIHEKESHPEDDTVEVAIPSQITPPIASDIITPAISVEVISTPISTEIIPHVISTTNATDIITPSIAADIITPEIITPSIAAETITPQSASESIISPIAAQVTYVCEQCGRSVSSVHHLNMHLKSHRKFLCEICGKKYSNKVGLSNHSRTHSFECYVCKEGFPSPEILATHIRRHCVYEQWVDPANVYLSNWSPEKSREILQNQPLVMVPRLNVTDANGTYSVILDKPKDIEFSKVKDEPDVPPVVNGESPTDVDEPSKGGRNIIELKHFQQFDDSTQIVDVNGKVGPLKFEGDRRILALDDDGIMIVEQQSEVTTTFNDNAEVIDLSSESDIDEMELYHCYFCNETFRSLDVLGVHVKKCSFCP